MDEIKDIQEVAKHPDADVALLIKDAYIRGRIAGVKRGEEIALEAIEKSFREMN